MYDFVTIDFETANSSMNSACSIGLAVVKDLEIIKKEYHLIKPPSDHFRNDNIQIHGITYDDVKNSNTFDHIWQDINCYFNEVVIAHNAQFDMSVLKCLFDTYSIPPPKFFYMDSISISKAVCSCGNSLCDRAAFLDIDINNHHHALDDAVVCAEIVINSIKKYGAKSFLHFLLDYDPLLAKKFDKINATRSLGSTSKIPAYSSIKISEITPSNSDYNKEHPLYGKNIVLTGELDSLERSVAMQKIVDAGGIVKSGVSTKVDFLVVGKQDKKLVGDDGLSTKEEKAYQLIAKGCAIKIINESEFLDLLQP